MAESLWKLGDFPSSHIASENIRHRYVHVVKSGDWVKVSILSSSGSEDRLDADHFAL